MTRLIDTGYGRSEIGRYHRRCRSILWGSLLSALLFWSPVFAENWPQASGPNSDWKIDGRAPTQWSVTRSENILWRTTLPEGGQSSVTLWGDRAFVTTHKELQSPDETETSMDIVGYCLNANTGAILWKVELPGSVAVGTAGIFSDATVFAPVTDGKRVWFFNRSGSMACFDLSGNLVWMREYVPRKRHTNRQCEPILWNNQLLVVEVLDKLAGAKLQRHEPIPDDIDPRSVWTYLHGIDALTGEVLWTEPTGTVVHDTPMIGRLANGEMAVLHARGGGHSPLEKPYGITLTSLAPGKEGTPLWSTEFSRFDPVFNNHWNERFSYAFHGNDHVVLDTATGHEISRRSLGENVDLWSYDQPSKAWTLRSGAKVKAGKTHANTNQANIVVGDWHYFLTHDWHAIGRVHTISGKVEYLEVPAQLALVADGSSQWIWDPKKAIPIRAENARGINLAADKRATATGWGHVSAASPSLVGQYLYFPVMTGTVYVIDTKAPELSEKALVAINDLGPAGETWSLSSFSYADERLFVRTLKEVICIGKP